MSARLQLERAGIASETLAVMGFPALVIDERGKVLAANHLIQVMTDYVQWTSAFGLLNRERRSQRRSG
jgi:hypothetical protein